MNGNTLTCHRMNKLQPIGVQRLALDILSGAAVQIVAGQGIAQITAVDTNLMRTARMKRDCSKLQFVFAASRVKSDQAD